MLHIVDTIEKEITQERLLACIPGDNRDMYEDDVEDLLEQIETAGALHHRAAYTAAVIDSVKGKQLQIGDVTLQASLFEKNCQPGDLLYPCVVTVGKELDSFAAGLDDPMLSYLQGLLMNLCLDDALLEVAKQVKAEHPGKKLMMVKPGVAGVCELSEQQGILSLLENAPQQLGITVSEQGFLTPAYSSTALLFLSEEGCDVSGDWEQEEERKRILHELNVIAGHI